MAATQRGIPRPRRSKADLELRGAILEAISKLHINRSLSILANQLGVSAKTLSRYRNPDSSATLGGDILFRILELCDGEDISVVCRGRVLRLQPEHGLGTSELSRPEQLRFRFAGTVEIEIPARKGMMKVDSLTVDGDTKTG